MVEGFDRAALAVLRRAYARQMLAVAGVRENPRLLAAFAAVPRERFLGPGPWALRAGPGGYREVPADPALAYQDVLFGLDPGRGVNNGSPSLHARLLHALAVPEGGRILHLGAGSGYYTALLAELAGPGGQVTAVEFDPALAARARANLAPWPVARVVEGDAARHPEGPPVDGIYVNFSVGRPAEGWIAGLAPGGRLVLPLGVAGPAVTPEGPRFSDYGAAFCIRRVPAGFAVEHLGPAFFIHAEGTLAADGPEAETLRESFLTGGAEMVRSLRWGGTPEPPERCWFWSPGWSLSYDPPGGG